MKLPLYQEGMYPDYTMGAPRRKEEITKNERAFYLSKHCRGVSALSLQTYRFFMSFTM
jgi:hypothetical protein